MRNPGESSRAHIAIVQQNMLQITRNLTDRLAAHDADKLVDPAMSGYDALDKVLEDKPYGSPARAAAMLGFNDLIQDHVAQHDHHINHGPRGIFDMSMLAALEMLADWKAAGDKPGGVPLRESLIRTLAHYRMEPQLTAMLVNTAKELGWI